MKKTRKVYVVWYLFDVDSASGVPVTTNADFETYFRFQQNFTDSLTDFHYIVSC